MGLTSGRGSHSGKRRRHAGGARHDSAGQGESGYGRTNLVGGDRQESAYQSAPVGGGQRGGVSDGGYGHDTGEFDAGARNTDGYGYGRPGAPGRTGGWDGGPARGGEQGPVTAFLNRMPVGRRTRAGRRHGVGQWLKGHPAPVVSVVAIAACAVVVAAGFGVNHILTAQSVADTTANPNCTLIVPANPLTAQGLATPYQLTATNPAAGPCDEANNNQTAFVQGAVLNPATGQISIYDPVVVDVGAQPAVAPVAPTLPAGAVVAVWFGYNGTTLSLVGADQNLTSGTGITTTTPTDPATSPSASVPASAPADSATPTNPATATPATATPASSASASAPASTPVTGAPSSTPSSSATAGAGASVQSVGSAPLQPSSAASTGGLSVSLTSTNPSPSAPGTPSASATAFASATPSASSTPTPTPTPTSSGTASPTASIPTTGSTTTIPSANSNDAPAASPTQDAILQQANCVAGEDINGDFSSFTQVGACNATAFFNAANQAIVAQKLRVPAPGIATDGQACLTTRSFALIDQDQSDNVTTEYLTTANGQIAQDTVANRISLAGATTLFNGSDNGLLDLFVDPALGCSPWEVPNLADGGAPAPGLPLDELQAATWAGSQGSGPSALVPLNDPMTVDNNGNFSTDKTNTYRSLVDMPALPVGESPAAYCSDMEQIQGSRLQQDVNLLINGPSPQPAAASNLFTFMAMRLQQSFMNLNCGSFGMNNDVSTTADGNGVVVAACFADQVAAVTSGPGNPTAGQTTCPATTGSQGQGNGTGNGQGTGQPSASPSASTQSGNGQVGQNGMSHSQVQNYWHHHRHG